MQCRHFKRIIWGFSLILLSYFPYLSGIGPCGRPPWPGMLASTSLPLPSPTGGHKGPPPTSTPLPPLRDHTSMLVFSAISLLRPQPNETVGCRVGAGAAVERGWGPCGRPPWPCMLASSFWPLPSPTGGHKGPPHSSTPLPPLRDPTGVLFSPPSPSFG